jgi:hypothetical protein
MPVPRFRRSSRLGIETESRVASSREQRKETQMVSETTLRRRVTGHPSR